LDLSPATFKLILHMIFDKKRVAFRVIIVVKLVGAILKSFRMILDGRLFHALSGKLFGVLYYL